MSSFKNSHIHDVLNSPVGHLLLAKDAGFALAHDANVLVKVELENLASVHEDDTKDEQEHRQKVLPPVLTLTPVNLFYGLGGGL